jgi:RNA polymerase sigma-70 factor (ECF subfamily)
MDAAGTRPPYLELRGRLRPFIARRVPAADIDDVEQEVFLRVERSLVSLRDEESFAPWLYSVARSAIAERQRQSVRLPLLVPAESLDGECAPDDAHPSALEEALAAYLVTLIERLPSPYREAITLTEIEGMTHAAAADALGASLTAVKSRVQRGRRKLREMLEQCCRIALDARGRVIECSPRGSCCEDS